MADAACLAADPEMFFPGSDSRQHRRAKRICTTCPVIEECLEYAIEHKMDDGVWGGTSARERKELRWKAGR